MTQVVEKQVRQMLAALKSEIQNTAKHTGEITSKMAAGLTASAKEMEHIISVTRKLGQEGNLTETIKGYDALGTQLTLVKKNAELASIALKQDGAFTKDVRYANELYAEQVAHLKRIHELRTQRLYVEDASPKAATLDTQIEDTNKLYQANQELIAQFNAQVVAKSKLAELSKEEARYAGRYAAEQTKAGSGVQEIRQLQEAYQRLTTAHREYDTAKKAGSYTGMSYWQQSASGAMQEIRAIQSKLATLDIEESTRRRLLDLIQQSANAEAAHAKGINPLSQMTDQLGKQMLHLVSVTALLRGLSSLWRNALTYGAQYYDLLNEIRIVSGQTQKQADEMGNRFRAMAKDMRVSSTDIARAAVEFYRQGLPEMEVDARLDATIKYSKIASMAFDEAAQLMTAAVNTMDVEAMRVADVWAYLGDESASGADEIGTAMKKASASALEFGLSFEWLSSMIASVSESTRSAPELIGNSFNSIIARMHNIKERGFTQEDSTRVNDVAKALRTVGVELLDQDDNWRDMSTILEEVAVQWDGLNGKQRAYLATVMAGTRQQNVFLALMNDMSKGIEGGSRTYELYTGAVNSAGTASQKFMIWQESVEAAQSNLTASMERFYALLSMEWMKGFYNGLAGIVDAFNEGTDAMNGWNVKLPLIIISVAGLVAIVLKLSAAIKTIQAAGLAASLTGGTVGLAVAGIGLVIAGVTALVGSMKKSFAPVDYSEQLQTLTAHKESVAGLRDEYVALASKENRTADETQRMDALVRQLSDSSLGLKQALSGASDELQNQADVVDTLNQYLLETEARINSLKREEASSAFKNLADLEDAQENLRKAKSKEDAWSAYDSYRQERNGNGSGFLQYANQKAMAWGAPKEERDRWRGIVEAYDDMEKEIGHWYGTRIDEVNLWFDNLALSASSGVANAAGALTDAWQVYIGHLNAFATGEKYLEMNPYFQKQMDTFFAGVVDGIDVEAEVTEAALTEYATRIKAKQDALYAIFTDDKTITGMLDQHTQMMKLLADTPGQFDYDAYTSLIQQFNRHIADMGYEDLEPLELMTEDQLRLMREAQMELLALSNGVAGVFDKIRQTREAETAADNNYLDQITELRKAYAEDETGTKFIQTLNNMQAANDKLFEGMLETHGGLAGLADGIMMEGLTESLDENGEAIDRNLERQQRYAQGMEAFAAMERVATRLSQESTEKLLQEAEATRALEEAKQTHYATILQGMRQAYQNTGYDAFVAMWEELGDTAKSDFIELYPEVVALATAMGETADGAQAFALAIDRAANMDFTDLMKAMRDQGKPKFLEQPAQEAKDAGYASQLAGLENALKTGSAEAMQRALYDIYTTNEVLYASLMDTYTILYKLGNEDLTDAQGAEIMAEAYLTMAKASAKSAEELRKQIALEEELEAASENYYRATLEKLQSAYHAEGTKGFHDVWDGLDDAAQRFILKHYAGVGDLATETIARSTDVVDEIFGHAFEEALAMKRKLLAESLTDGAASYMLELPSVEAGENGFQEQLKALRDALENGSFLEVLAGFGEEMANALIAENEWLNVIIASMTGAEEGTLSLMEATALLDEHIQGTQAHFLASIETLVEANTTLLETEDEQIGMLTSLMALLEQEDGVEAFAAAFSKLDAEMRKAVYDKSPAIRRFFQEWQNGAADAEGAVKEMSREVNRLKLDKLAKEGKIFTGLADAMDDAAKGGKSFSKSYGAVMSQVEALNEAMGALAFVQSDGKQKADDLADAYNVLASYTGVSAELLRTNLDPALWAIASDMDMATESAAYLTNWLYNAAGVQFDASNWQAQLAALAASSDATVAHLAQLVQTLLQAAGASLYLDGNTVKVKWGSAGSYTPPSARKSGGGGGGSGSKDMEKAISAIEQLLDLMRQTIALQDHSRELMQLAQDYHEVRGEVQGVIAYMQREQQVIAESTATMQAYVAQLEAEIAVKQQQVATTSTAAKEYEQLAKELDELQKLHQDYSKQLIRNRTDTERLTKAMKEQRDSVRQMEIDLRNLIHDAILDREERTRRMLSGTIDLEQEIIDILTKRYEMERDELIRLADLKRQELQEEIRLLDEQLAKRRELEEQEDKLKKLAQLEAQLARISMDPTRRKEELALREEIAKLRREIAWDMAEDEVDAQKDALQQQLDSVEEYLAYIEEYYEELLSNPRKLIEEMSYLLRQTDEEILAWLTANHAEYESATDAMRQNMVMGWQEMFDDMRGHTRMFWDEVEDIIAQGDEAIISFLMQHSEDYRTAGRLQAEAYVDQWQVQLENLRNAYKQVYAEINSYSYATIPQSTYTPPSSSGGGSSGGSSGSVKASTIWQEYLQHYPMWAEKSKELQDKHLALVISNIQNPSKTIADWLMKYRGKTIKYAQGGMADYTGLAWLDGTKARPERILSSYQTELFEDLLASLHDIRIKTPVLPGIQGVQPSHEGIHIEQITVHVERLESEADYEEMAEKVGEYLYDEMTRGTARQFIR